MKAIPLAFVIAVFSLAAAAQTTPAEPKTQPTAQQSKMATCNKEAGDRKGDERKAFMKECLKTSQQDRMKQCNKDAADKKGDERKAFMKECLSKKG